MSFCKFNSESLTSGKTFLDNLFITQYLPYLSENCIKVYTFGAFMCQNGANLQNSLDSFCKNVRLPKSEVIKCFDELEKNGLVQKISAQNEELEYAFLKTSDACSSIKKYDEKLYSDFNVQVQNILPKSVMISPNQFNELYSTMEIFEIEKEAMLLVAKYCTNLKGEKVNANYICAVAKNFALQGAKTASAVNQKLLDLEKNSGKIKELLFAMKIMRPALHDEYEMFLSWKKELKFDEDLILFAAKASKAKSFNALNKTLNHYYKSGISSQKEIEAYEKTKKELYDTASSVVKNLGLFYENLDPVVENYVLVWFNRGMESNFVVDMAKMCFKQGIRTLEKMNGKLDALFAKGVVNFKAFDQFAQQASMQDDFILQILKQLKIERQVSLSDRSFANTWLNSWKISKDLILYAASLSQNALSPFKYMNTILAGFKEKGIESVEEAKKVSTPKVASKISHNYEQNTYSAEKLNSVFANLDEVQTNE